MWGLAAYLPHPCRLLAAYLPPTRRPTRRVVYHQPAVDLRRRVDVDAEPLGHALLRQHGNSTDSKRSGNLIKVQGQSNHIAINALGDMRCVAAGPAAPQG